MPEDDLTQFFGRMPDPITPFGERLFRCRRKAKLTHEQVADALGVAVSTLYRWESGESLPNLHRIADMADLYGEPFHRMFGGLTSAEARSAPRPARKPS